MWVSGDEPLVVSVFFKQSNESMTRQALATFIKPGKTRLSGVPWTSQATLQLCLRSLRSQSPTGG